MNMVFTGNKIPKDYLDLVRRHTVVSVINQHQVVVGVVTMRDGEIISRNNHWCYSELLHDWLNKYLCNVSQRMIAEDFEMVPVVRSNQILLGVITRFIMKMSRSCGSPTNICNRLAVVSIIMMKLSLQWTFSCLRKMVSRNVFFRNLDYMMQRFCQRYGVTSLEQNVDLLPGCSDWHVLRICG